MLKNRGATIFWSFFLAITALTILDRFLKTLAEHSPERFGWRFFAFEQFHNTGVAFNTPIPLSLVLPLTLIFLITLVYSTLKSTSPWNTLATAAVISGALSNAYDRIMFGHTIDYFRIFNGIINIADILIVIGIGLLIHIHKKIKS
jgi:lipoprotein signal peptidase